MVKPVINVTPLIDVLLVLLIIFMVITPVKLSSFEAKIPAEPTDDPLITPHPDTLVVVIGADSALRLNTEQNLGSVDEPEKTTARLAQVFRLRKEHLIATSMPEEKPQTTVFIKAPRGLSYGKVARVVDAVKSSGASPISLQIDDLQ